MPSPMHRRLIDVTRALSKDIPVWPGSRHFEQKQLRTGAKDGWTESEIQMNIHTGTHVDAPLHFLQEGADVSSLDPDQMMGKVWVKDCTGNLVISRDLLDSDPKLKGVRRVFFKTRNSENTTRFDPEFVALESEAAEWLADRNYEMVGVDGPSVQRFSDSNNRTHEVLLSQSVFVVENLILKGIKEGPYEYYAFPLKILGAEGAPARVFLVGAEQ